MQCMDFNIEPLSPLSILNDSFDLLSRHRSLLVKYTVQNDGFIIKTVHQLYIYYIYIQFGLKFIYYGLQLIETMMRYRVLRASLIKRLEISLECLECQLVVNGVNLHLSTIVEIIFWLRLVFQSLKFKGILEIQIYVECARAKADLPTAR